MDLTPEEKDLVRSYLPAGPRKHVAWVLLAVGLVLCVGSAVLRLTDWRVVFVAGLILVELARAMRERARLARILRKYDAMAQRLRCLEEGDETL